MASSSDSRPAEVEAEAEAVPGLLSSSLSQFRTQLDWQEGSAEDFKELHEAKKRGLLVPSESDSESGRTSWATGTRTEAEMDEEEEEEDQETGFSGAGSDSDGGDEDTAADDDDAALTVLEQKLSLRGTSHQKSDTTSEEDDEPEPPRDAHGPRLLWLCSREAEDASEEELLREVEGHLKAATDCVAHRDGDGYSAMHRAAYSGHKTIVKRLLDAPGGPDLVRAETPEGWTPLHSACRWNRAEVVDLLLQEGANPNARTEGGQTPLHLAAFAGNSAETLQVLFMVPLLERQVKNCQGDTPRDIALRNGNSVHLFEELCSDEVNKA